MEGMYLRKCQTKNRIPEDELVPRGSHVSPQTVH